MTQFIPSLAPEHPGWTLISWNVAAKLRRLGEQVGALAAHAPDVVALQEVTARSAPLLRERLAALGLPHAIDSFALAPDPASLRGLRRYGELIAARWPLTPRPPEQIAIPWPERVLSAIAHGPWGAVEVHNAYVPPGITNGWVKIATLEGLYARLACPSDVPRILCGDFNAPKVELPSGEIVTWGQRIDHAGRAVTYRSFHGADGARWDRGERMVIEGLAAHDLADVYRTLRGWQHPEPSWVWRHGARTGGYRFDHVFAARSLQPAACRYLHDLRDAGLSDHAPLLVRFTPSAPCGSGQPQPSP